MWNGPAGAKLGPMAPTKAQRILVIEDDDDIREFTRALLEKNGFGCETAITAKEGLAKFREAKPDLAVVDINLPDGSGIAIGKSIREESKGMVPVIFATANRELKTRLECFQNGAQDYIQKPYPIQELLARIRVHLDIKKVQDELLEQNRKLELLTRARQDMVDMIVHDLKTPLASIKGTLELVQVNGLISNQDYKVLVDNAGTAADFMLLMLNDLLDLGQAEHGELRKEISDVDVNSVVERLGTLFAGRFRRAKVKLKTSIRPEATMVRSDHNLLFRILVNLVSNALAVSRAEAEVEVSAFRKGDAFRLTVSDRGPGVRDAEKQAIFEKYTSTKRREGLSDGGSGIGLAFCKLASRSLGGKVWVEDRPGGGSVFLVDLPLTAPAPARH